jgi:hypothetical protein
MPFVFAASCLGRSSGGAGLHPAGTGSASRITCSRDRRSPPDCYSEGPSGIVIPRGLQAFRRCHSEGPSGLSALSFRGAFRPSGVVIPRGLQAPRNLVEYTQPRSPIAAACISTKASRSMIASACLSDRIRFFPVRPRIVRVENLLNRFQKRGQADRF